MSAPIYVECARNYARGHCDEAVDMQWDGERGPKNEQSGSRRNGVFRGVSNTSTCFSNAFQTSILSWFKIFFSTYSQLWYMTGFAAVVDNYDDVIHELTQWSQLLSENQLRRFKKPCATHIKICQHENDVLCNPKFICRGCTKGNNVHSPLDAFLLPTNGNALCVVFFLQKDFKNITVKITGSRYILCFTYIPTIFYLIHHFVIAVV